MLHVQWPLYKVNICLFTVTQFSLKKETNGTFCLFEIGNTIRLKPNAWIFSVCVLPSLFVHQKATKCYHWTGSLLFISVNCYSRTWMEQVSNRQQVQEKTNQGTVVPLTFLQLYQHKCLCSWCEGQGQRTNPREKKALFLTADFSDGFFSWKIVLWGAGRWGQWRERGQDPAGAVQGSSSGAPSNFPPYCHGECHSTPLQPLCVPQDTGDLVEQHSSREMLPFWQGKDPTCPVLHWRAGVGFSFFSQQ